MSNIKKFRIIKFKTKPLFIVKNISKSFNKRVILRKIDMHLNKGEMLGLLGSNGAGKSTFMNIILGLLKSDFGDIFLNNVKLTNLPIHERSKLGIAYLPQQTSIFRGLTVYENLLGIAQIVKKGANIQKLDSVLITDGIHRDVNNNKDIDKEKLDDLIKKKNIKPKFVMRKLK